MKNNMGNRSRRNTMAIAILCILGVLSVAYAAFSTNLKINLAGTATNKWNIRFANLPTVDGKEIFINKVTSGSDTPSAGTVEWGDGGETEAVNIGISNLKFANLDNEFYYVFSVKNSGNIDASLTTPPALETISKDHTYYRGDGETKKTYTVDYNATFFNAGSTKPTTLADCMRLEGNKLSEAKDVTLAPGSTTYWLLKVNAKYNGDDNTVSGNTVFETDDTLEFTITPGTWQSVNSKD